VLEYIQRLSPDLLVTEQVLPKLDAFGVLRLMENGTIARIPTLFSLLRSRAA
jgi:hypothetical protein